MDERRRVVGQRRFTVDEAARFLGVSSFTLRVWLRDGRLPYYRVGRRIVFDRGEIEQYLAARRVEARVRIFP